MSKDISETIVTLELPQTDSLEQATVDAAELAIEHHREDSLELITPEEVELAAARSSGYQKMASDDTVGAFFKEMGATLC